MPTYVHAVTGARVTVAADHPSADDMARTPTVWQPEEAKPKASKRPPRKTSGGK